MFFCFLNMCRASRITTAGPALLLYALHISLFAVCQCAVCLYLGMFVCVYTTHTHTHLNSSWPVPAIKVYNLTETMQEEKRGKRKRSTLGLKTLTQTMLHNNQVNSQCRRPWCEAQGGTKWPSVPANPLEMKVSLTHLLVHTGKCSNNAAIEVVHVWLGLYPVASKHNG